MLGRIWRRLRAATEQLTQTTPRVWPEATVGAPYTIQLTYQGAIPGENIVFELEEGEELPPGMTLHPDGEVSGTPTEAGTWTFNIGLRRV